MAKLMIMPSARSRYVKDDNMNLIFKILIAISVVMVLSNYIMYGFMYGIKQLLMILVALLATREIEILFYTHDKNITREEAKNLIQKSYYKVTALIFVLLVPIGTPLWLTALGAVIATLLGKLLFGGYHHMVFHSSLVGFIFLTEGWKNLVGGVTFAPAFDNYLLELLFDNKFFNETLSLSRLFGYGNSLFSADALNVYEYQYQLGDILSGLVPGVMVSGILLLLALLFLIYKKAVNYVVPTTMIFAFVVTSFLTNGFDIAMTFYQLFTGSFLFVTVFVATDFITTPIPDKGKVIFGIIAGSLTIFIRNGSEYNEGVVFAVLFMMMLTPFLNTALKKKPVKKVVKKEA